MLKKILSRQRRMRRERGDSLLEVMLSISVIAMISVGSMTVMQRGNATMLIMLTRTQARASLNSQTELLSYLQTISPNTYKALFECSGSWPSCASSTSGTTDAQTASKSSSATSRAFFVDSSSGTPTVKSAGSANCANTTPTAATNGGVWIDAIHYAVSQPYTDFYIKACWAPAGTDRETKSTSISIVRIYDK